MNFGLKIYNRTSDAEVRGKGKVVIKIMGCFKISGKIRNFVESYIGLHNMNAGRSG